MSNPETNLPPVFEPVHLQQVDDVAAEAVRRARAGAPEGTLVWSEEQRAGAARLGRSWESPPGGLYASVVFRPEFDWSETGALALIGTVALGSAIAGLVAPMTELRYRWPSGVLVGGTRIAGLWLQEDCDEGWLVLSLACNVREAPGSVFDGGCLSQEGGEPDLSPALLLEHFARQLLGWLNRWSEDGLAPVTTHFAGRSDPAGTPVALTVSRDETLAGRIVGFDDQGGLVVDCNEKRRTATIRRFYGLD